MSAARRRAPRAPLERVHDGRRIGWYGGRWIYLDPTPQPPQPTPEQIVANPTDRHPRWRLRVFDLCWPWRASMKEVLRDARSSGNGRYDEADRLTYLDAAANIQRDPPHALDRVRAMMARGEL